MAESSNIAWTRSTFNPWASFPEPFASFQLAHVADAVRLEVAQFVAGMAQRHAVGYVIGQFGKFGHRLVVMRAKVAAFLVTAVAASVVVALKNRRAPGDVFRRPTQAEIALKRAVPVGVVILAFRSPLLGDRRDFGARLQGVFLPEAIRRAPLRGLAHLRARFRAHFGALLHG